jgi:probable F420-dependent oxidoreductase
MDVLSEGRIQIGLGAGWKVEDYEQSGIPYDPPGTRVSRFIEGVQVIKSALGPTPFSFDGDFYSISDYDGFPKPLQDPPPILIGGGGPRILKFAARNADIVGINATVTSGAMDASTFASMTPNAVDDKVAIVRTTAEAAGRIEQIEMNVRAYMTFVTDDIAGSLETLAGFTDIPTEEIAASPFALVGPTDKLVDDLQARRERWGFSYIIIGEEDVETCAPVVAALAGT